MDVTAAFSAARWAALTDDERRATAEQLLRELPQGFALVGVEGRIARFEHDDRTYALVPGGPVRIGFDVARWQPSKDERRSWTRTAKEYRLPELHEYLAKVTRPPRDVQLPALLVATRHEEVGWEPLALDDPRVAALPARERTDVPTSRVFVGGEQFELGYADGRLSGAWRARRTTHADEAAAMQRAGFRLLTSDEWEHACGAGAATLFRWGDHAPCDRYPPDASVEHSELVSDFDHHRRPNAFGLHIAADPYQAELVAEAGITRGGDGGSMICGGAGYFMGWLPLATAWFDPAFCQRDAGKPIEVSYTVMRRVLPLT
jgi:hypothetical protein